MGLDMYLNKRYYIKGRESDPSEELYTISVQYSDKPANIPVHKIAYIETEEMYWRKANAIHRWFVENVQHGNDDCGRYYVSRETLAVLLDIVRRVLRKPDLAPSLLPTQSGFYYGETEYDQDYYEDLQYTKDELERLLAESDSDGDFEYHSSW